MQFASVIVALVATVPAMALTPLTGATAVAASGVYYSHPKSCAVVNGGVLCWGQNTFGQLGNNSTVDSAVPVVAIPEGSGAVAVASAEYHACALVNGGVKCWGGNGFGQLGSGPVTVDGSGSKVPVSALAPGSGATAISLAANHTCAVVTGGVQCWGSGAYGAIGLAGSGAIYQPFAPGSGVTAVATATGHTCVVKNGGVWCLGENPYGELGNGTNTKSVVPVVAIPEGSGATAVAVDESGTSCAVVNGFVECWGNNGGGQLGDGTRNHSSRPLLVIAAGSGASGVAIAQSSFTVGYACAVVAAGVRCWGAGPFDDGTPNYAGGPVQVIPAGAGAKAVGAASGHVCALVNDGIQCWGSNSSGQLGDGGYIDHRKPTPVMTNTAAPTPAAIEYYHAGFGHYFVTANSDEITKLDNGTFAGWTRTGLSFHIMDSAASQTTPVCRFFTVAFPPTSSHFYTANQSECALVKTNPDWTFEGQVFHAQLPASDGSCASGTVPLYRMYNNGKGGAPNHRFATEVAVRSGMLAQGWVAEGAGIGVGMCVPI
jgi:hypothetical protein